MKPIDDADFAALLKRYKDALLNYTKQFLPVKEDAEDVCQRAFEKAFVNIESYDPKYAFSTWLFNIARNLALDQLRRGHTTPATVSLSGSATGGDFLDPDTPEDKVISGQIVEKVTAQIDALPPLYRDVARLRFISDCSYSDISEELGIPIGTVKTRINRARKILAQSNDSK